MRVRVCAKSLVVQTRWAHFRSVAWGWHEEEHAQVQLASTADSSMRKVYPFSLDVEKPWPPSPVSRVSVWFTGVGTLLAGVAEGNEGRLWRWTLSHMALHVLLPRRTAASPVVHASAFWDSMLCLWDSCMRAGRAMASAVQQTVCYGAHQAAAL